MSKCKFRKKCKEYQKDSALCDTDAGSWSYDKRCNTWEKHEKKEWGKKKSYNPLKMWGAYTGAFFSVGLWLKTALIPALTFPWVIGNGFYYQTFWQYMFKWDGWRELISVVYFGFFVGWVIHSVFRRLRK